MHGSNPQICSLGISVQGELGRASLYILYSESNLGFPCKASVIVDLSLGFTPLEHRTLILRPRPSVSSVRVSQPSAVPRIFAETFPGLSAVFFLLPLGSIYTFLSTPIPHLAGICPPFPRSPALVSCFFRWPRLHLGVSSYDLARALTK